MNGRKQRRMGRLLVLLWGMGLIVGLSCLIAWWEMRKERLSAQLLATVRSVQYRSEVRYSEERKAEREQAKQQTRKDEATVVRLLQAGADPSVRDVIYVDRTPRDWDQVVFLLQRIFKHPPASDFMPQSALAMAVQSQDAVLVSALLKAGADDVNGHVEAQKDNRSPLVNYAASIGNLEMVQALCAHGADVHKLGQNSRGESTTILRAALTTDVGYTDSVILNTEINAGPERKNRSEIFHLLCAKGAKYEPNSQEGFALLRAATLSDLLEPVRELLAAGVPVNAPAGWLEQDSRETPLDSGVANDDLPMVKLLLQHGAQTRERRSEAPILLARSPEIASLLLENGADLHARSKAEGNHVGENALNFASLRGDTRMVQFLIEQGFNANANPAGWAPIEEAAEYGGIKTVRLLLQHGARVGPNSPGRQALWLAIANQHFESAKLLLRYGAAVNPKPLRIAEDTEYPLEEAVEQDDPEMVRELLKWGANPNADEGRALLEACATCDEDLVEVLLEFGADPTVRLYNGTTAIQMAKQNADPPRDADGIVALLKDYGAKR